MPINFGVVSQASKKPIGELLVAAEFIQIQESVPDGTIVKCLTTPWRRIYDELEKNPELYFQFAQYHRKFEEFIASAYERVVTSVFRTDVIQTK